ncbi:dihydrolipoyllysine-residue acetyltransferase [Malassezia nana]|uniref:Dihydrolipoyllysine-residue acetyltransferase component of pyruvate dehydrogenase complex, mitochondrial n=1 Tax=Malassezia nana TaxID=180528 RepID=A0AAF0EGR8_9BASI|nr:dihydrolipoyllysine-residue acetyltransferase [Malassezia nana]
MYSIVRQQLLRASHRVRPGVASLHTSVALRELSKFTMPAMSPTMQDGGIAAWRKEEGESFNSGDVLLEIQETDKATMEVEATDDGVLAKIIVAAGAKNVPVNSTIAIVGEEGDDLSGAEAMAEEAKKESASAASQSEEAPKKDQEDKSKEEPKEQPKEEKKEEPKEQPKKEQKSSKPQDRLFATPAAKRLALERGVPLREIKGSGPEGRILQEDVEKYKPGAAPAAATASTAPGQSYEDIPLSNMRRVIASRLTESKSNVPHYYVTFDIDMDRVNQLREIFNRAAKEKAQGDVAKEKAAKLSVNDFIVKAAAIALKQVPEVNSAFHGEYVRQHHVQDISMAVSTPTGLITPILRNCGALGLAEIGAQNKALAQKARDGKLKPEEYQGGTFTISNMGMMGTSHFTAIINPPQSCILAIGATEARLVPDDSERGFRVAHIMKATLSSDHRVVDGATAARWMQAFKAALQNPLSFML